MCLTVSLSKTFAWICCVTLSMFVCLSKTLTGSEVKYTVILFPKKRFCFVKIQSVLSNRDNFLEKNDTFNIALIF